MNNHSHNTAPAGAARVPFDYKAAYADLEELICSARSRSDVLHLLSDNFMGRDRGGSHVHISVHELDCLLFMIDDTRSAIGAVDEKYRSSWPDEAQSIVDRLEQAKQAKAKREHEEDELCSLIQMHRSACTAYDAAVADAGELAAPQEAAALVEAKEARWKEASAALLSWRPSTFAGNADRIRYLSDPALGPWRGMGPTEDELTMLFASMVEAGNGQ